MPFGMPIKPDDYSTIEKNTFVIPPIPAIPFAMFQEHVEKILTQIEGVSYKWNAEDFYWFIESGVKPRRLTLSNIVNPAELTEAEKQWSQSFLWVYWDDKTQSLYLDHRSFMVGSYDFYTHISEYLKEQMPTIVAFLLRYPYLSLISGTKYNHTNHVQRILFDAMYSRELCSWLY